MPLVEIRVPTYERPEWLLRALQSLQKQTHQNWKAIVLDDSENKEGKEVVENLGDDRIHYQNNTERLGGAENIDQAFKREPFFPGSEYASILEDDNWYYPEFIQRNIEDLDRNKVNILLRNQDVWEQDEGEPEQTKRTTRGKWFEEKIYSPEELHSFLLFHEGISNGGLFWKTDVKSKLVVGEHVEDPGLQEFLRTLQINEPLYFASESLCVWAKMPGNLVTRYISRNRTYSLGKLAVMRHAYAFYGKVYIDNAYDTAVRTGNVRLFEESIIQLGKRSAKKYRYMHVNMLERYELWFKTRLKERVFRNPLKKYFKHYTA